MVWFLKKSQFVTKCFQGVVCETGWGLQSRRAGMGRRCTPGRIDALREHLLPSLPRPWASGRISLPGTRCLREMLPGAIADHLLPPPVRAGDGMWAVTTGARRCLVPARSQRKQDEWMGNRLQVENCHHVEALTVVSVCARAERLSVVLGDIAGC